MRKSRSTVPYGPHIAADAILDQVHSDAPAAQGPKHEVFSQSADVGLRKIREFLDDIIKESSRLPEGEKLALEHRLGLELIPVLASYQIAVRQLVAENS